MVNYNSKIYLKINKAWLTLKVNSIKIQIKKIKTMMIQITRIMKKIKIQIKIKTIIKIRNKMVIIITNNFNQMIQNKHFKEMKKLREHCMQETLISKLKKMDYYHSFKNMVKLDKLELPEEEIIYQKDLHTSCLKIKTHFKKQSLIKKILLNQMEES